MVHQSHSAAPPVADEAREWFEAGPLLAALPMYDWPEERALTDATWAGWRDGLRDAGVPAPDAVVRRGEDVPAWPGAGAQRDPARLDEDALWRHPRLLLAQTCWGPLDAGLLRHVHVIAQPDYSAFTGGDGIHYRSAIVVRGDPGDDVVPPDTSRAQLPERRLQGRRLARSKVHSLSGAIALSEDLTAVGLAEDDLWAGVSYSGSHRESIRAVAAGVSDVAAIDCRSLALARTHEPAAAQVQVIGWTARRRGLPLIASGAMPASAVQILRTVAADLAAVPYGGDMDG